MRNLTFLVTLLLLLAISLPVAAANFDYELVPNAESNRIAMTLDPLGRPIVLFRVDSIPGGSSDMWIGRWTPFGWNWETAGCGGNDPLRISADLDSDGDLHILMTRNYGSSNQIQYLHQIDGAWQSCEFVDWVSTLNGGFSNIQVRVDDTGRIHGLASRGGLQVKVYRRDPGVGWAVPNELPSYKDADLGLSASSSPAVAYRGSTLGRVAFAEEPASNPGGPWSFDYVATVGSEVALDFGSTTTPHVVYKAWTGSENALWYGSRDAGFNWNVSAVILGSSAEKTELFIDAQQNPHATYFERPTTSSIDGYVYYVDASGGSWSPQVVGPTDANQGYVAALDPFGNPHVVYWDITLDAARYAGVHDCDGDGTPDDQEILAGAADCNANGIPDDCEFTAGVAIDCNSNGIPDDCDISSGTSNDCNSNGIPDECDLSSGTSTDCNVNGIPDECETLADCNNNGIPDLCDLYLYQTSEDCNQNSIPDECEPTDCNNNGIFDSCDINDGTSLDCDGNGVPDECDLASGAPDCNNNGTLDVCDLGFHLTVDGEATNDAFGHAIAAGDINGDNIPDLIVGAPEHDTAASNAGRVYVFYGGTPMDATADLVIDGEGTAQNLGNALATGDVNNDGYDDMVIAMNNPGFTTQDVQIHLGSASPSAIPDYEISTSYFDFDSFGHSVATADINGDNFDDVIIGAPSFTSSSGRVEVYSGADLTGSPIETWVDENEGDTFGSAVANAGDIDGNGVDDIIIGAPAYPSGANQGRAYLFMGTSGASMTAGPVLTEAAGFWRFGGAVSGVGDVNNDGTDDWIVGSWRYNGTFGIAGRAYLYHGGAVPDASADLIYEGLAQSDELGRAVSRAGDVNGDGIDDLLLGASGRDFTRGSFRVHQGSTTMGQDFLRVFNSDVRAAMGHALTSMGDVNGDGYADFAVGAPEHDSNRGRVIVCDIMLPDFVDVNGDGLADVCSPIVGIAEPPAPRHARLIGAFPTPFNPSTKIRFELDRDARVTLKVFDASGRLVATLLSEMRTAGPHDVLWSGRDTAGQAVASGVYLYQLQVGEFRETKRMVLLK